MKPGSRDPWIAARRVRNTLGLRVVYLVMEQRSAERSIQATPLVSHGRPARTFGEGRICRHPGCRTRLSIYNSNPHCYLHEPMTAVRVRGKKIA